MGMRCHTSVTTLDIAEKMVFEKLANFNINKSPVPGSMHPCILKECSDSLAVPLTELFRMSLDCMYLWIGRMLIYQLFSRKMI